MLNSLSQWRTSVGRGHMLRRYNLFSTCQVLLLLPMLVSLQPVACCPVTCMIVSMMRC